jgi:hypothetical protein
VLAAILLRRLRLPEPEPEPETALPAERCA